MKGAEPESESGEPLDGVLDGTFVMTIDQFMLNFSYEQVEVWRDEEWPTEESGAIAEFEHGGADNPGKNLSNIIVISQTLVIAPSS